MSLTSLPAPEKKLIIFLLAALPVLFSITICYGQDTTRKPVKVEIEKKDATVVKGKLMGIAKDSVKLVDEFNRELKIPLKDIRNIEYIDSLRRRGRWFDSPNTMRYFLASTALPLKKKEIAFQATYLFLVSAHYGITDRISIGAGTEIIAQSIYFVNVKYTIADHDKFRFSAGANYYSFSPNTVNVNNTNESVRGLGMLYAAGTWGTVNHHMSLGAGYMYVLGGFAPPLVTLSGTARFAKRFALVTENWFFFVGSRIDLPSLISLGVRYISRRSTVDLAFFNDDEFSLEAGFPYIGYSFKISRD
jgi:hypothetical protein